MTHLDILIVCMNADPPTSGFATRVFSMARALTGANYNVGVLRLVPAFHMAISWKGLFANKGVNLCYEFKIPPIYRFLVLRSLAIQYSHILTKIIARKHNVGAIQCEGHEAVKAVLSGQWQNNIKIVADIHGAVADELDYFQQKIGASNDNLRRWFREIENRLLRKASRIIVVSEEMEIYLRKVGNFKNIVTVPIGIDDIAFERTDRIAQRRKLGLGSEIVCVYSGGAQSYQCIVDTCKIILKLKEISKGLRWLILTNNREELQRELKIGGISAPNDSIILSVTREEVPKYLAVGDVAFLLRKNHVVNIVSCPTKFGEYLAAGLPVVATSFAGHAPKFINKFGVGCIISENFEAVEIKLLLKQLKKFQNDRIRAICTDVARRHLSWNEISKRVVKMYASIY
jgi:glycosyltransferase involved in cell wall biosynthesis